MLLKSKNFYFLIDIFFVIRVNNENMLNEKFVSILLYSKYNSVDEIYCSLVV
jgi:hypothetical protein